ncbi:unnamed protein product, partial [marine sediment metagenome]
VIAILTSLILIRQIEFILIQAFDLRYQTIKKHIIRLVLNVIVIETLRPPGIIGKPVNHLHLLWVDGLTPVKIRTGSDDHIAINPGLQTFHQPAF